MNNHRQAAQAALEQHDFTTATKLLTQHLVRKPNDLEAELELVVAHFMNGNDGPLVAIHDRVGSALSASPPQEGRLARLWAVCQQLFRQLQHAAAIAACASLPFVAGCNKPADGPADQTPTATVQPTTASPGDTDTATPTATPTAEPTAAPTASETTSEAAPATSTLPPITKTQPASKYAVVAPKYGVKARYMVPPKMRYRVNRPF